MKGTFVKHTHGGIGKVEEVLESCLKVRFLETGEEALFSKEAFSERELRYYDLPLKSECISGDRICIIEKVLDRTRDSKMRKYLVSFQDDGVRSEVCEKELVPTGIIASQPPIEKLQNQDQGSYSLFAPRERLNAAIQRQLKTGNGLRALLASRIDLRPHQAYVAGIVLLDESRRYLLADEVGLGKTVEAGIVIHDLLISKPDARILVLCPGALTQQWLCELYSKFSGQVFRMLEMLDSEESDWANVSKLIASFSDGGLRFSGQILEHKWDLVVVDEVHHLLASERLYEFVHQLSKATPSILLLSAIPAKRREDEFLRLLALLEPNRYSSDMDKELFKALFDSQRKIGRKLRLIRRRLEGLSTNEFSREELLEQVSDLLEIECVSGDPIVFAKIEQLRCTNETSLSSGVNDLLRHVAENFRINRRILRNRRQRLIEDDQIMEIRREIECVKYESEQLEHEVNGLIEELLRSAIDKQVDLDLLDVFATVLWQSTVHPNAVSGMFQLLAGVKPGRINANGMEFLRLGYVGGMNSWEGYTELLCRAIKPYVTDELIQEGLAVTGNWRRDATSYSRLDRLLEVLQRFARRKEKVLIFVGYPGVAESIASKVRERFGDGSTTEFLSELEREEKEGNVVRFRSDPNTWIMVSDESGGEGRNFQFVDWLIHFDNPWNASRIEQRIGRLDRLGRENPEVCSLVISDMTSVEDGLVQCLSDGLGVYSRSISGLEFSLREIETRLIRAAIEQGKDGLRNIVSDIQEDVEAERDRDESEAVLDEASFDRKTAERFLRVKSNEGSEIEVEESFLEFFKMIAASAKPISDSELSDGLWSFDGDRIHQIRNAYTNQLANRKFKGTFRRAIAQKRIDLEYFGVGNQLFEAIYHSLHVESLGRTYAIEVFRPEIEKRWLGFEFIFYPRPNSEYIGENPGLHNQARQYFGFQAIHVFCTHDGNVYANSGTLLELRRTLAHKDKGSGWKNITGQNAKKLANLFQKIKWEDAIANAFDNSREFARNECLEYVAPVVAESLDVLDVQIRNLRNLGADSSQLSPLLALRQSIDEWDVELDSLGFLSVNAGVFERLENG